MSATVDLGICEEHGRLHIERVTRLGWAEEAPAANGRPADEFVRERYVGEWRDVEDTDA
jgi:hypothetical protein